MQRQAVPAVRAEAPVCRHRQERRGLRAIRGLRSLSRTGVTTKSTPPVSLSAPPTISTHKSGVDIYRLMNTSAPTRSTCINQRPLVKVGDQVTRVDSTPTVPRHLVELALRRNVSVAFIPWNGYNFEYSILLSSGR